MKVAVLALATLGSCVAQTLALARPEPINGNVSLCEGASVGSVCVNGVCNTALADTYSLGTMLYVFKDSIPTSIYDPNGQDQCYGDYLMPMFASEIFWTREVRIVFYLFLLVWCFIGVAIISDYFMAAIEVIASKERVIVVQNEDGDAEEKKVLVWDETVANLTLMALGSSAPEIMLSVIETLGTLDKPPEDGLGPSTIVGSAAFNLLVINAVCVGAIKDGEKRDVERYPTFLVTAFFSVFAYLWMLIVLTPEEGQDVSTVTIPEAIITLLLFPLLVVLSYIAANKSCGGNDRKVEPSEGRIVAIDGENHKSFGARKSVLDRSRKVNGEVRDSEGSTHEAGTIITLEDKKRAGIIQMMEEKSELSNEEVAKFVAEMYFSENKPNKQMHYRIDARKKLLGGKGLGMKKRVSTILKKVKTVTSRKLSLKAVEEAEILESTARAPPMAVVAFASRFFAVQESAGEIVLPVIRTGTEADLAIPSTVYYETRSGTARAGEDYEHASGKLEFAAGETSKEISVKIIDDNVFEPDEDFSVVLSVKGFDHNANLDASNCTVAVVTIIDDDTSGIFSFPSGGLVVRETDGIAKCVVQRSGGTCGRIKIAYKTSDFTAKKGTDYYESTGTLVFEEGVREATIEVVLIDDKCYDKESTFAVELEILGTPENGAVFGEHKVLSVTITSDTKYSETVDKVADLMQLHLESMDVGTSSWGDQFKEALEFETEDGEDPSISDCILHILSFGWKVIFALVPPTSIAGGWLSFFVSLVFIGLITMAVGDIAKMFGCLLGIPAPFTAITFVALGTSLPDTFASKTAAENDDNADNSIGNVTGSNSVNVFLGLGLPWVIGAFYKSSKGEEYQVKAGKLNFSVYVFVAVALIFFVLMTARRRLGYGELGGPAGPKKVTVISFVFLWVTYVILSGLQSMDAF